MNYHRITTAFAVLAALLIAQGTAQAQMSFGHFGDFSSSQGAAAQFSAAAPGMYGSGEYAYVGPWTIARRTIDSPPTYPARVVVDTGRNIYFLPAPSNTYQPERLRVYPSQPNGGAGMNRPSPSNPYLPSPSGGAGANQAPRPDNAYGPASNRSASDLARYYYNLGFHAGYNESLTNGAPVRIDRTPPNPFASN